VISVHAFLNEQKSPGGLNFATVENDQISIGKETLVETSNTV